MPIYIRHGCQLPSNLPTDPRELGRIKEVFDYFCIPAFDPAQCSFAQVRPFV
jgi:hypothetical protein